MKKKSLSITHSPWPIWVRNDGSVVSCVEKIKVMNENMDEISALAQDALEDGLLMDISEGQIRLALHNLIDRLVNHYQKCN